MELIVKEVTLPEALEFNYEELKKELTQRVSEYKTVVYTADTIKTAKADRSSLNKLKTALNDERIRWEREYMAPFMDFKNKVAELCGIIDEASACVDKQVKEYEKLQKEQKAADIQKAFDESLKIDYPWLDLLLFWNDKWLNASYKMKQITDEFAQIGGKIKSDLEILSRLPEYSFEAGETYKRSLKLEDAMWTVDNLKQMAEAKARAIALEEAADNAVSESAEPEMLQNDHITSENEQNQPQTDMPNEIWFEDAELEMVKSEPQREWLSFRVLLSMEEAIALNNFFRANNIRFEKI